ncbi:MAG: type II CAAX endopeptidase family protein [Sphaerochaeta sp.]|nr:type II CAAX endopeptidase family protein [Sphaerochaeta sp.]
MDKEHQMEGNMEQGRHTYQRESLSLALSMVLVSAFWILFGPVAVQLIHPIGLPYLTANAPFLAMGLGIVVSLRFLLARSFTQLATDHSRFRFPLFGRAFLAYFFTATLFLLFFFLSDPDSIDIHPAPLRQKLLMLLLVVVITPMQTSSEEVLFRILPVRIVTGKTLGVGKLHRLFASLFSALLFALPHLGNRELTQAQSPAIVLCYYALFGFLVTSMSLQSGGFEIALAVHAANNLFVALICNYQGSSLPSLPLFESTRALGTWTDLAQLTAGLVAVWLACRSAFSSPQAPKD